MRFTIYGLLIGFLLTGCASYMGTAASGPTNVITKDELATCSASDVLEAIQLLRPQLLNKIYRKIDSVAYVGGGTRVGSSEIPIYFDGARRTGLESLSHIEISGLKEIIYVEPEDAAMRFGTGHAGGAIIVRSK